MNVIENKTFDEIAVGDEASLTRTLTPQDVDLFAVISGAPEYGPEPASKTMLHEVMAHGSWGSALISSVLGTLYPGPGTVYVDQKFHFSRPVAIGDTITATVRVQKKFERTRHVIFDCKCVDQAGRVAISGTAEVLAPPEKVRFTRPPMHELQPREQYARHLNLIAMTKGLEPISMAVVHPCDREALGGAIAAAKAGLIRPVLVGPEHKIRAAAKELGADISGFEIVATEHSHAAAAAAVGMAREEQVEALMKGSLHTDELMAEVVATTTGLRTGRRVSHVFVMDVPTYPKPLLITDAAINIEPDLETKRDIVQNAIDLALVLGIEEPKVAILSAVETVTPSLRSTIDAASLCKMAQRGQISGGVIDGPLAFDNAVSLVAAKTKGIVSAVAGRADILVVPDLESGNMVAKQLDYLANAQAAGVVVGARVPIVLTSRADPVDSRIASCAIALLMAHKPRKAAG